MKSAKLVLFAMAGAFFVAWSALASSGQPAGTSTAGGRVGAICRDGWQSSATGSGACSHHHGVDHWIYR